MFKRRAYNELLRWKRESNGSRALLLEGARRVGKSTLAKEFAEKEYAAHLVIDFSEASDDSLLWTAATITLKQARSSLSGETLQISSFPPRKPRFA